MAVTSIVIWQLLLAGIVIAVKLTEGEPALKPERVALQPLVMVVSATVTPGAGVVGKLSVKATLVSEVLEFGLVSVKVSCETPPELIVVGLKALEIVGGELTVNVAVALVPVPPFVEVGLPVVLT